MSESLFSDQWFRVAQRTPCLRASVRVRRQTVRGQVWYVLTDEAKADRVFRLDAAAYAFVGRCTGAHTVQAIWDVVCAELGDGVPSQGALLRLMVRLQAAGLLYFDHHADIGSLFSRRVSRQGLKTQKLNPLAFRVRLGNPTRVLEALAPLGKLLITPIAMGVWWVIVVLAVLVALTQSDALSAHASQLLHGNGRLWLLWGVYPVVKLVHELAHGLAVRRWDGEVSEWGVALLVFMPMPYVDASAASAFRSARQRAVVSAAGIMAELMMASIALGIWLLVQPGLVRDVALTVVVICSVSTLLANGNPLLRFDGYFVLTDLLDLPNLADRSRRWWLDHLQRWIQGYESGDPLIPLRGETPWLWLYQPLSWLYRLGLSLAITLWLGHLAAVLGYLAGFWFVWSLFLSPIVSAVRALLDGRVAESNRLRSRMAAILLAGLVPVGLFAVPVPDVTLAHGVAWWPDTARIRNETAGFVAAVVRQHGEHVEPGDVILQLADDELVAEREQLVRERDGLQTALFNALRDDPVTAGQFAQRVESVQRALRRTEEQIDGLSVRAAIAGRLVLPAQGDLPGRFVPRGKEIGIIRDGSATRVRLAVPDDDAAGLVDLSSVSVRLSESPGVFHPAQLIGQLPEARRQLPAAALGMPAGGPFAVDPKDEEGLRTTTPVVWVDLIVPDVPQAFSGGRVQARFEHGRSSLATLLWRRGWQLLLGRFDPEGV
ncbi:HlyD family secretion protein [Denitromonas iodatirespirans]|uniref:HlyD family efflux transporter periplasmic adaptor subunit n=1 Tax=Denitromonas iodatirespirans TaxID=2795389 RepID=A0A944H6P4_DENI1|nr:HlyD family secretion protein [Denitromonas iodatirespirans]MBT0960384.1 hypothetical protein [Denitromonas iodatirespirans]